MSGHKPRGNVDLNDPFLGRLRLLTHLGDSELSLLEDIYGAIRTMPAKKDFVREHADCKIVHVLHSGWACRFKVLPDGHRHITDLVLPGDICDLGNLYLDSSDHGVAALTACTVVPIHRAALRDLASRHPGIERAFAGLMAMDHARLTERSACLGRRRAHERLAHFLCDLLMRLTLIGHARDNSFTLFVTQQEIADALGLTGVHVNRVMQGLKSDGLIEQHGHQVNILDLPVLRRIGGLRAGEPQLADVTADERGKSFRFGGPHVRGGNAMGVSTHG